MSDQGVNDEVAVGSMPDEQQLVSPGARLAACRKERGWTIEQVASQLNLAPRQVAAIESDNYPALPGMPIVRGFVRAYAKLLKIDTAPLLAGLGGETVFASPSPSPRKTLSTPFSEGRVPSIMGEPGLSSKWIVGLLLAVLSGVAIWASQLGGELSEMSKSASSQVKDGLASITGEAKKQSQAESQNNEPPAVQPPAVVPPAAVAETANSAAIEAGTAATAAGSPQLPVPASQPAAPSGRQDVANGVSASDNALVLKAREDSWVEIRRASGNRVVFSRILKAGETESIELTEPVSVVIGNAGGVDATSRGTLIEMRPASKSNVARLTLK